MNDLEPLNIPGTASHSRYLSKYKTYLSHHRGIRYFRITVPNHLRSLLGKTEIRRSLDGMKSRTARSKAVRLSVAAQTFFALVEEIQSGRIQLVHGTSMQHTEFLSGFVRKLDTFWFTAACEEDLSPAALTLSLPKFMKDAGAELETGEKKNAPEKRTRLKEHSSTPVLRVEVSPILTSTTRSEAAPKSFRATSEPASSESRKSTSSSHRRVKRLPTVSEAAEAYISAKSLTWSKGSIKDIPPQIRQFAGIIKELEHGKDISLLNLTREHIRRYHDTLRNLPFRVNGKSEYKGLSWLKLADLGREGKVDRLLSLKTMQVRQINVRSFINWCELEYQGKIQARYLNSGFPPAMTNKDIRRKGTRRTGFTHDELHALFSDRAGYLKATEGKPTKFWAPWIALYTGMRVEEICQLHISDIRDIDGVTCFSINENGGSALFSKHVKTLAGIRTVPIHRSLWEEAGLKKFVENRRVEIPQNKWSSTLLFPDMQERLHTVNLSSVQFSAGLIHWFTRYRRAVGVGGQEGETSSKTFHSFRHTVVEYLLKEARVPLNMVQTVVGHEVTDMGVTEVYAGEWPMRVLLEEVIMKLRWHEWL